MPRSNQFVAKIIPLTFLMHISPAYADEWVVIARGWQDSAQQAFDELSTVERHAYGAAYRWNETGAIRELSYEHQAILVRAGEPASNGYFHRLDATVSRQLDSLQLAVTFGVHGSSNMFNKFKFHSEAIVGSYSARLPLKGMQVGINGDYRFNSRFQNYPVILKDRNFNNGSLLSIELPVRIAWQSADSNRQLSLKRYGEKWAALDSETDSKSATYFGEWQLQGRTRMLQGSYYSLSLLAGLSFDSEMRYLDLTDGQISTELEKSFFLGIETSF